MSVAKAFGSPDINFDQPPHAIKLFLNFSDGSFMRGNHRYRWKRCQQGFGEDFIFSKYPQDVRICLLPTFLGGRRDVLTVRGGDGWGGKPKPMILGILRIT